jgi:tetratricopeptide (TPR) repeat protein
VRLTDEFIRSAAMVGLLGLVLACAAPEPVDGDERDRGEAVVDDVAVADVVVAENSELASTADDEQQRRIHELIQSGHDAGELAEVIVDYPLDESIFPPEMIAPTFLWHDKAEEADRWLVDVSFAGDSSRLYLLVPGLPPPQGEIDPTAISDTNEVYQPTPYQASAKAWKPSAEIWEAIKTHSVAGPASVTFFGYRQDDPKRVVSRGGMTLSTSRDPVGAPIFYRDVPLIPVSTDKIIMPLPKAAFPLIGWRLRDVSQPDSRLVLRDMPTCVNCHSFSADGKKLGMDIDGPTGDKGAYAFASIEKQMVIENEEIITWNSFKDKPEGHITYGFLSQVSPDGQTVLSTVNEAIYVINFRGYKFGQVFYTTRGILAYYSQETGEIRALPGADDPAYVQTDGVWTPDGKTVVFARGPASDPFLTDRPRATYAGDPNETPMLYELYRIPFNDGRGGQAEPIAGASNNGMSNNFPKVSPDGKWIVFVKCRNGQLLRPDGKLWIVPAEGGEARLMRCNTPLMNSWHSFSPNGRWMVFSSKANRPFTQLFLTHIDEEGNDSPAILIENCTAANRAVNIPEFVNISYEDLVRISVPQADHYRHYHRGNRLAREGRYEEAIAAFEEALELLSDSRIHNNLAKVYMNLGQNDRALLQLRESLKVNPYNFEVLNNLAYVLSETGSLDEAREHLDSAIRVYPQQPRSFYNRGMLSFQLGDHSSAITDFDEALRLSPGYSIAYSGRGMVFHAVGDHTRALSDFDTAIRLRPQEPTPWYFRAAIRADTGNLAGALHDVNRAREVAPPDFPQRGDIENLHRRILARLNETRQQ